MVAFLSKLNLASTSVEMYPEINLLISTPKFTAILSIVKCKNSVFYSTVKLSKSNYSVDFYGVFVSSCYFSSASIYLLLLLLFFPDSFFI